MPKQPLIKTKGREEAFARAYVENGFNGSNAAQQALKVSDGYKRKAAHEMIQKPSVQRKITEVMEEMGLTHDLVTKVTRRNMEQSKNYAASNSAVDIYHRIHGNYAPEKKTNLNLNLTLEQAELELKDLLNAV